jgi:hypothetical protein
MNVDPQAGLWTWAQFNAQVDTLCPLECKRIFGQMNPDGSSAYYRGHIRQAVLDLSNYIPEFNRNHETLYYNQDFVADGQAHVGALPPLSKLTGAWLYSQDRQRRFPVVEIAWERRFSLAMNGGGDKLDHGCTVMTAASLGAMEMMDAVVKSLPGQHVGVIALSPKHEQFYVFPKIDGEWVLSLFWDGQKLDYREAELVPFEEEAAFAVALWVQGQFASYIDHDYARAAACLQQYNLKRNNLYLRTKEKGALK